METNIFKDLHMEQNEVVMCRFLADLPDPRGWHGCGTQSLESFMREFVELESVEKGFAHLERTCVMTEYLIETTAELILCFKIPCFPFLLRPRSTLATSKDSGMTTAPMPEMSS